MRLATIAAALVLALSACASKAAPSGFGPGHCASDADCGPGLSCYATECIPSGTPPELQVDIATGNDPVYAPTQFANQAQDQHDFHLEPALHVTGTLKQSGAAVPGARVIFAVEHALLPDVAPLATTGTTSSTGTFDLRMSPGRYTISVIPPPASDPSVSGDPPPPSTTVAVSDLTDPPSLWPDDELLRLVGALTSSGAPLADATVIAVDGQTLEPLTQSARTSATGEFRLTFPPNVTSYFLRVTGSDKAPLTPSLQLGRPDAPTSPFQLAAGWTPAQPLHQPLEVGALASPATLKGSVVGPDSMPVAGAQVRVMATGEPWSWSGAATTDSAGKFTLQLPQGGYDLTVVPPSGSAAAMLLPWKTLTVTPSPVDLNLQLSRRSSSVTRVFDAMGMPVAGATLRAERQADPLVSTTIFGGITAGDGSVSLALDPGPYLVNVEPPPSANAPSLVAARVVESRGLGDLHLARAATVHGTIYGDATEPTPTTRPLAGLNLDFYVVDGASGTSSRVAGAQTDASGAYTALVPSVER